MNKEQAANIFISTGEASGERLAVDLVSRLRQYHTNLSITAMGSTLLQAFGATILVNNNEIGIIGFTQIISKWFHIRRTFKTIKQHLQNATPDLVILIDYSGFNLRLAKVAKKAGCKVLYYVSPQIWATRFKRIHTIKRYVDHMAVLYPFEKKLYDTHQISASYVGHPALTQINTVLAEKDTPATPSDKMKIALLPGSRLAEINTLLPVILKAAQLIQSHYPDTHFILPLSNKIPADKIKSKIPSHIEIITDRHLSHIKGAHCAICTSGTVTLEVALLGVPHVIIYKTSKLTWAIASRLLQTPYVGLPNVLSQQRIVPELLQNDATAQRVFQSIQPMINDDKYRQLIEKQFQQLRKDFNDEGQTEDVAKVALNLLSRTTTENC